MLSTMAVAELARLISMDVDGDVMAEGVGESLQSFVSCVLNLPLVVARHIDDVDAYQVAKISG